MRSRRILLVLRDPACLVPAGGKLLAAAIAWTVLAAYGCSSGALPFTGMTEAATRRWPGTTDAELYRGRSLYRSQCSGCHGLYSPAEFTPAQWDTLLPAMQRRARTEEADRLPMEKYVLTHAKTTAGQQ